MSRAIICLLVLGVICAPASAADKYTSRDGKYSVEFPAPPKETNKEIDASKTVANDGRLKLFYSSVDAKKDVSLMVIYNDYKEVVGMASPQKILQDVRDGSRGVGRIINDKEIAAADGKPPGREYIIDKGNFFRARVFLAGNRLYQVVVVAKSKEDVETEAATKFIDSFEIAK